MMRFTFFILMLLFGLDAISQADTLCFPILSKRFNNYHQHAAKNYIGGKYALREYFMSNYKEITKSESNNGYIFVKFVLNCNAVPLGFQTEIMSLDFRPANLDERISSQLVTLLKNIKKWKATEIDNSKYDTRLMIGFKIENGKLTEIIR